MICQATTRGRESRRSARRHRKDARLQRSWMVRTFRPAAEHDVNIGSPDSKGAYAGPSLPFPLFRPWQRDGAHLEGALFQLQRWIRAAKIWRGRDDACLRGQRCFDETRDTSSDVCMSHIALDGTEDAGTRPRVALGKNAGECGNLNRVAQLRSCAVCFHVANAIG